jgi:glycolate oxidase FAD binding subunit
MDRSGYASERRVSEAVSVRRDPDAAVLDRLRQAAGADAVRPPDELRGYAVAGVAPRAVVAPDSPEAAARTLALCSAEGWPVEPAGAATWLFAGAPPAAPPIVITTARLRRIREYEPANLVVGVEAGMPLDELAAELAARRQTIPLDPPAVPGATIGAAVALAAAGPLRAAHGTPRDMIIGAEVVAGDGRVLHFGGRVVKNVAGYDLVRFLVGSRGALGLLTAVFIRLRGAPDLDTTTAISATSAADALALAAAIRGCTSPDALEVVGPALAREILPEHGAGDWTVLVRLRGSDTAVAESAERLGGIAAGRAARSWAAEAGHAVWQAAARSEARASLCVRVADVPSRLPETVAAALRLTGSISASGNDIDGWRLAAHAADGIVRAWSAELPDSSSLARLDSALPPLAESLAATGGTVRWPVWPASTGTPRPALTDDDAGIRSRLVAELRARFDPAGIMSPGRHDRGS